MTTPPAPNPHTPDPIDAVLRDAYTALVDDLRGRLDLIAGVEQATEPGSYQNLTQDVARHLDLERGLAAITHAPTASTGEQPRPEQGGDATPVDDHPRPTAGLSARERLELRVGLAFRHLRNLVALEDAMALRAGAPDPVPTRDEFLELPLDSDLVSDLNLIRDLSSAHVLTVGLTRGSAFDARVPVRVRDLDLILTRARDRARSLGLDLDLACARARHLAELVDGDLTTLVAESAPELANHLRGVVDEALRRCRYAVQRRVRDQVRALGLRLDVGMEPGEEWAGRVRAELDKLADDFVDADVRAARLPDSADLTGLRWSRGTRWPPGWADVVRMRSEETAPGVFTVVDLEGRRSPTFMPTR